MKYIKLSLLATGFLFIVSCSQSLVASNSTRMILVGSTPGEDQIKKLLTIPLEIEVDFIRWELTLEREQNPTGVFTLNLVYGMSKPNTRGFIKDNHLTLTGKFSVEHSGTKREKYLLTSEAPRTSFSFTRLNDDLFHILTPDDKLMVGNSGWSYTLNSKDPGTIPANAAAPVRLPSTAISAGANDTSAKVVFSGRTPCTELAAQFALSVPADCFKLKWKMTLDRDPKTFAPTTYTMQRIDHRPTIIEGKWAVEKKADAMIYRLDPGKPAQSIALLAADENILLLLDKNGRPFVGNGEFSYTLNKAK